MTIIIQGEKVILRDRLVSDADSFVSWQTHGEWRFLDAPWEGLKESLTINEEIDIRERFIKSCADLLPSPRNTVIIADKSNRPLGWINGYQDSRSTDTIMVGIDIREDDMLNAGAGTEAIELWIDYIFTNSNVHRLGLDTWSFNPRMIHVAEKVGFTYEGSQREVICWEGEWLNLIHFGILRFEWKENRISRQ
jgi:RimJ/RimL family protein N-acetyltransferase